MKTQEIEQTVSNCCFGLVRRVKTFANPTGYEICIACGDPCTRTYPPCPMGICDGSGLVGSSYYDHDSHSHIPDGDVACLHTKDEDDYDPNLD